MTTRRVGRHSFEHLSHVVPPILVPTGTTQIVNWDLGNVQVIDLDSATGPVTLTLSNPISGAVYRVKVIQGSVARNLVWPAAVKWPGGVAPTISVANNAIDVIELVYDGSIYLGRFSQAFA